jgi:hypothetical protein
MRQIGLIPAGCQQGFLGGVSATSKYFVYASSVAIYFLNPSSFLIEKIIAYNSRSISNLSIHSRTENDLLLCSLDGTITVWNIQEEEMRRKVTTSVNQRSFADWDTLSTRTCIVVMNSPNLNVYTWKVDSENLVTFRTSLDMKLATVLRYECDACLIFQNNVPL